jgi:hypothetical protein
MFESKNKSEFLILDFDIEARPLSYMGGDYVTREITAIACKFINVKDSKMNCWALGEVEPEEMFTRFLEEYNKAGMVTGHYISGYDLSTINGAITEYGFDPLQSKLVQDTYLHLVKRQGQSNSQENLSAMLGLEHPKIGMNQQNWRDANRLTKSGITKTKERVIGDVEQHIEMRQKLIDLGMLGRPKMWSCAGTRMK